MINLTKESSFVSLDKVPSFDVVVSWPAATDYDLGAEILYKDGTSESLATFGAGSVPALRASRNGTVELSGDAGRGAGVATETLSVQWDNDIARIAPWVYSAQSNGTGSFRQHRVTTEILIGEGVRIDANNASRNPLVYTLVPGEIFFEDGSLRVEYREDYSPITSEKRPIYARTFAGHKMVLRMNGPKNNYK